MQTILLLFFCYFFYHLFSWAIVEWQTTTSQHLPLLAPLPTSLNCNMRLATAKIVDVAETLYIDAKKPIRFTSKRVKSLVDCLYESQAHQPSVQRIYDVMCDICSRCSFKPGTQLHKVFKIFNLIRLPPCVSLRCISNTINILNKFVL